MPTLLSNPTAELSRVAPLHATPANPIIDWIDRELGDSAKSHTLTADLLLDLRQSFAQPLDTTLVRRFFVLLGRLEQTHFLLAFRIRQWLSLDFQVEISDPLERVPAARFSLPASLSDLKTHRRQFFEISPSLIPWNDIRISFIRKR